MQRRDRIIIALAFGLVALLLVSSLQFKTNQNLNTLGYNLYATITVKQYERIVFYQSGLDPLTNLGLNLTFAKLTGSNSYNLTTYNLNATYVSLGNYTSAPTASSVVLPNEWIRVLGTIHAQVYNGYNLTATFSDMTGTNSTNCMGIEYSSGLGNSDLFAYTTFNLVTGIDSTFTITAELQVQGTTS